MTLKKKLRIIPHTHWDKEWYFTAARSLIYSLKDFDEVITILEEDSTFPCFHLDGQLSIVEEYLELHPEKTSTLIKLVKEGKLIIGPWYTQPDTLVVSGESLLKNLEFGIFLAKKYGRWQSIGYLPDSFGMSCQMPQIYKQFGLQYAFFRRGFASHLVNNREFIWESPNGSRIFTHHLHHYGNMAYPPNEEKALLQYYSSIEAELRDTTQSDCILLYNGEDQKPIRKNLPQLVELGNQAGFDIKIESLEGVLAEIEEFYHQHAIELPVYQGEFTFGQFSRVHKSIFSTRADLKQLNNHLEHYLANIVQPLCSLAVHFGLSGEQILVDKIWSLLLLNAAHDSIGNCNSDETNEDIRARYIQANRLSEELVDFKLREIGSHVQQQDITQFQVYNLLPNKRTGYVQLTLFSPYESFSIINQNGKLAEFVLESIEDVSQTFLKKSLREIGVENQKNPIWPNQVENLYKCIVTLYCRDVCAMGYHSYRLIENEERMMELQSPSLLSFSEEIENERYKLVFEQGKLHLFDKLTERRQSDFLYVLDDGDEGDSYDYSSPLDDVKLYGELVNCTVTKTPLKQSLLVSGRLRLPTDLAARSRRDYSVEQAFQLVLELEKGSDCLLIHLQTVNSVDEHRVRLVFRTGKANPYSFSDVQFATIKRENNIPQVDSWLEEKWDEKPRNIEPFISYVANGFSSGSLQIISEGVREYQFIGETYQDIALTLYRSVPYLGKSDLQDRPGRESGTKARTEGTRHMGQLIASSYALRILTTQDDEYTCALVAKAFLTPLIAYQSAPYKNNTDTFIFSAVNSINLPLSYSLFELDTALILSVLSTKRESHRLLLRCFNPYLDKKIDFSILSFQSNAIELGYMENCLGQIQSQSVECQLNPGQFTNWTLNSLK